MVADDHGEFRRAFPVDKAAQTPSPLPLATRIFAVRSDADGSASKRMRTPSGGGAVAPHLAPPPAPPPPEGAEVKSLEGAESSPQRGRQGELARLRAMLAALERRHRTPGGTILGAGRCALRSDRTAGWTLGASEVDGWLPEGRLDAASLNEIKPETFGDSPAALAFTLRLAARRLRAGAPAHAGRVAGVSKPGLLVWCWPTRMARETGRLYGPGLAALGINPTQVLLVECATTAEVLWTVEESIASQAAAIVVGCVEAVALTPARRLALATQAHRTPGLLVTAARSVVTPATFARWRIAACPSAPHPFDPEAPGAARFALTLERCRGTAADTARPSCIVEWSHEAHRFGVVADVADRALEAASRA